MARTVLSCRTTSFYVNVFVVFEAHVLFCVFVFDCHYHLVQNIRLQNDVLYVE